MPRWKMLVVKVGVVVVGEMVVRLSKRIIVGMFVVVTAVVAVVVVVVGGSGPRLVRSGGIFVNAVSCLQPAGGRFGYAASTSWSRQRYQT